MQRTIKGKEVSFNFGLKFIMELDKAHKITQEGVSFGAGLETTLPMLISMQAPSTLVEYLKLSNKASVGPTLSENEIIEYIDLLNEEEYVGLFDEVTDTLREVPAASLKIKALEKAIQK